MSLLSRCAEMQGKHGEFASNSELGRVGDTRHQREHIVLQAMVSKVGTVWSLYSRTSRQKVQLPFWHQKKITQQSHGRVYLAFR